MRVLAVSFLLSAVDVAALPASAPSPPLKQYDRLSQMKASLLHSLASGAGHLQTMLASAGMMMGDPEAGMGMYSRNLVHREYEAMTGWWCANPGRPANSTLCARRAFAQSLKSLNGDAKKAAVKAQQATHDAASPAVRKAMSDEAKRMVDAYCKAAPTTMAVGATTTICARSLGILEMGKRLFQKRHNT